MPRRWAKAREDELRRLVDAGGSTYGEIAEAMGLPKSRVAQKAHELGLTNPTYRLRRTKHKHLRRALLEYYGNHTAKECMERFGLTASEFKSCLTVGYMDPALRHLRKDKRRHDAWSVGESIVLLRRAGVQPRGMIARGLKRGGMHAVKEQLSRLRAGSKFLNGMPAKWVREAFPAYCDELPFVKTCAGPTGGSGFEFVIVPWVALRPLLRRRIDPILKQYIRIMSTYQRWIWAGDTDDADSIVRRIEQLAGGKKRAGRKTGAAKSGRQGFDEDSLRRVAR